MRKLCALGVLLLLATLVPVGVSSVASGTTTGTTIRFLMEAGNATAASNGDTLQMGGRGSFDLGRGRPAVVGASPTAPDRWSLLLEPGR